ncbi:LmbE family protein (modular protein) [Candidatus Sulfopaludibacter sp. SbA3]|nr:LmbE family protein (modular protein) [Candidatus Sulfopaludibacter sp. SbA3]
MQFHNSSADFFVPDGASTEAALSRTTHLCISAHQDDIEIMAYHGIAECFGSKEKWFTGVVVTNGAGSPRSGIYAQYTDREMQQVRLVEQRKAAYVGDYSCQIQLGFTSAHVKNPNEAAVVEDLTQILRAAQPECVYLHNLADKHDTHIAVVMRSLAALRAVDHKPKKVYGCEVWRDLDWLAWRRRKAGAGLLGALQHRRRAGGRFRFASQRRQALRPSYRRSPPRSRHLFRLARHRRGKRHQLRHGLDPAGRGSHAIDHGLRAGRSGSLPRGRREADQGGRVSPLFRPSGTAESRRQGA